MVSQTKHPRDAKYVRETALWQPSNSLGSLSFMGRSGP